MLAQVNAVDALIVGVFIGAALIVLGIVIGYLITHLRDFGDNDDDMGAP